MADFPMFGRDLINARKALHDFINYELPDLAELEMSRIVHDSFEKEQYQGKPGCADGMREKVITVPAKTEQHGGDYL